MGYKIYYFSGTGNSLAVARDLGRALKDNGEILSLTKHDRDENVEIEADILGLVFPVYFKTAPDIVKSFIRKFSFKTNPYIFAIATCNGSLGHSLFTINKLLKINGHKLASSFVIDMPGNALVTPPDVEMERLKNSKDKVFEIAEFINSVKTNNLVGENNLRCHLESTIVGMLGKRLLSPRKFSVTNDCTGCGVCEKVCPMKNIEISDHKPQWGKRCARCLGCFHWCPKNAVTMDNPLGKRSQYHHPEIVIKDMHFD